MALWTWAGSTAMVFVAAGSSAFAAVTPESVWENWQTILGGSGQTISTTSVARDGDTLVVSGLTYTVAAGDGATVTSTIGDVRFTDAGDGTVDITIPESYPISMTFPAEGDGKASAAEMTVSQPGLQIKAAGDEAVTTYDFNAPSLAINLRNVEGTGATSTTLLADIAVTSLLGGYSVETVGEATSLKSQFTAATTTVSLVANDPELRNDVKVAASVDGLAGTTNGNFLPGSAMADMAAALKAGFAAETGLTYGKITFDFDITEADKKSKLSGTAAGGNFDFVMSKDSMSYGTGMKGAAFNLSGSDIPFPQVALTYAEGAFNVMMPITKSDVPQPFSLLTRIVDLTVSDEIWAMADPSGTLPRDPVTVVVDTKGTANWAYDIMDPAAQAAAEGQVPGQLHSLDITQLEARAVGAEVKGSGALTFDNTDLATWDGMPTPTGQINLSVKGANGVIDKLVQMGIVPEDQAMGARMMIAMFAKPGEGEDMLNSTLEFKDKGFFANGQRLR